VSDFGDNTISVTLPPIARLIGRGDAIPSNIPKGTIRAFLQFDRIFSKVKANLEPKEKAYFAAKGHVMPYSRMLEINDEFLGMDCTKYSVVRNLRGDSSSRDVSPFIHASFDRPGGCVPAALD
jgi:hypothetical protein